MSKEKDVYLDASLRGWIVNTAHKEHWRMASWYSVDDLIQDGYLCYAKCFAHYRGRRHSGGTLRGKMLVSKNPSKEERRWFMAVVQQAFYNHIMTLAAKSARTREDAVSQIAAEADTFTGALEKLAPAVAEEASVLVALATLPTELVDVLERLLSDGFEGGAYLRHKMTTANARGRIRETSREHWDRVLGKPDVPEKLTAYFKS